MTPPPFPWDDSELAAGHLQHFKLRPATFKELHDQRLPRKNTVACFLLRVEARMKTEYMRMSCSVYLEIVSNDWIFLKIIKFPNNVTVFTFPVLAFHTSNADKYERKKHQKKKTLL